MSVLVVSLPPGGGAENARVPWALVGADGGLVAEGQIAPGEMPALPEGRRAERAVALMPAQDVFVRYLAVPGRSEREAAQAAPFLVEEEFAAPLETQAVAVGPRDAEGRGWLLAVSKPVQARWRSYLAGLGVKPVHAVPDALLLDTHGGDLVVAAVDGTILFLTRAGDRLRPGGAGDDIGEQPAAGMPLCGGIDAELAEIVLPALGARVKPRRLLVSPDIDPALIAPDDSPIALKRQPAPDLRLEAARMPEAALARLPALFGEALVSGIDWAALARPWRRAAALAGIAVLGAAGLLVGEGLYYAQRAEAFYEASRELYRAEFDERAIDPAAQIATRLRALGGAPGESEFLELAAALGAVAAASESVQLESVRYSAERGGLSVTATYPDFADFEAFRAAAEAAGLVIEDGGARQGETGVTGDFLVRLS